MIDPKQMWVVRYAELPAEMPAGVLEARAMEISSEQDTRNRARVAIGLATGGLGLGAMLTLSTSNRHFLGLTRASGE